MPTNHGPRSPRLSCETAHCGASDINLRLTVFGPGMRERRESYLCPRCAGIALHVAQRHGVIASIEAVGILSEQECAALEARNVLVVMMPGDKAAEDIAWSITAAGL
jgi:hypothetical protein